MPEVLEIEQIEIEEPRAVKPKWDSWVVEIPREVAEAQGLIAGTLVSLTYRNGNVESEIIVPSARAKKSVERFVRNNEEFLAEMKRLGD